LKGGFQYLPPKTGEEMLGWVIRATFPTGPRRELRWHDGFIVEQRRFEPAAPAAAYQAYRLFFTIDSQAEWVHEPFDGKDLCFRKAHLLGTKVAESELVRAHRCLKQAEEDSD